MNPLNPRATGILGMVLLIVLSGAPTADACVITVTTFFFDDPNDCYWTAGGASPPDGTYNVAANWDTPDVPGTADTTYFNIDDTYTVTLDNDPGIHAGRVVAGDVTFTSDATKRTWTLDDDFFFTGTSHVVDNLNIDVGGSGGGTSVVVGRAGGGATLTLQNAGTLTAVIATIGEGSGDVGSVAVVGAGSTWDNSSHLFVGNYGTGELLIQDGGTVSNAEGYIGYYGGSDGTVTVDGTGSTWTNSGSLYVGGNDTAAGGLGLLTVQNGGAVNVTNTLKVWNTGTVELLGSQINTGSFIMEPGGTFTHDDGVLTVDGGTFDPGTASYTIDGAAPGDLPTVKLTGGATANLTGNMTVGNGQAGALEIRNGGTVSNDNDSYVGYSSSSTGTVTVEGADSLWHTGHILYVGYDGTGELAISSGATVSTATGYNNTYMGVNSSGSGKITVDGVGSTCDVAWDLMVGVNGTGELSVTNGATLSTGDDTAVGANATAWGKLTVDGVGSTCDVAANFLLGQFGTGELAVTDGAVLSTGFAYIDWGTPATGTATVAGTEPPGFACIGWHTLATGTATVAGTDSQWNAADSIYVGGNDTAAGGTGTLTVQNGGTVNVGGTLKVWNTGTVNLLGSQINTGSFIMEPGGTFTHEDGTLTVDGGTFDPGTAAYTIDGAGVGDLPTIRLTNSAAATLAGDLIVGQSHAAALEVRSGAAVSNTTGSIANSSSSDGTVTVVGAGSTWDNSNYLWVGYTGTGQLLIQDGGAVSNTYGYIGHSSSGSDGTVTLNGTGSTWTNSDDLYVGNVGTGQLLIQEGAVVSNTTGYIAFSSGSDGTVTLNGTGSTWTNSENLYVGNAGTGQLSIQDGATVSNSSGRIGEASGSDGTVTVTGANSTWDNPGSLAVGIAGTGELLIQDHGVVFSAGGYIGHAATGTGTVTVDGTGSTWENSGYLYVGNLDTGQLLIQNGGAVSNTHGYIGTGSDSDGTVTLNGAGSTWTNSLNLFVGGEGTGQLLIQDGGTVSNLHGIIGYQGSSNGTVTVTGASSTWDNSGNLMVADFGTGQLLIQEGGAVSNTDGYIGLYAGCSGTVTVTGTGSTWTNSADLYVGGTSADAGGTAVLTVETGATVAVGSVLKVWPPGTVNLNGGTIEAPEVQISGGAFHFNFGTLHDTNGSDVYPADSLSTILGGSHTIRLGQHYQVTGTTALYDVMTLDGGVFSTDSLVNAGLLQLNSGTLNLTGEDLSVGPGGLFGEVLELRSGVHVNVAGGHNATVDPSGLLRVEGRASFSAQGTLANSGEIQLDGATALIDASLLSNSGLVTGQGRIQSQLVNQAGGEVRGQSGRRLLFAGTGNENHGEINLGGGSVEFAQDLTNQPGGFIAGRGELRVEGGLSSEGTMALSGGFTDLYGDVTNNTDAEIVISGGSTTTFYDDVQSDGEIRVGTGCNAVFFGQLSGTGGTTGPGTVYIEGDLRPGNSTAVVSFGGNLVLGSAASLEMELNGPTPGSGHDQLHVVGTVDLGGAALSLVPGYTPDRGDSYVIVSNEMADPVVGQFAGFPDDSIFDLADQPCQIDYQGGDGNDVELTVLYAVVTGRRIFYNNSSFDDTSGPDAADVLAIATDKQALRPTQMADFDNYTSYSRGINGVMVDLAFLPDGVTFDESNFVFKVGNDDAPGEWQDAPEPASITTGPGEDPDTTRVTIIWDDYEIRNEWLQVTVLADGLEMPADDIFYFGNAVAEGGNSPLDAQVTTTDLLLARNNPRNFQYPADVEFDYDYDRDGRVNATDVLLARNNQTNFLSRLQLITTPYPTAAAMAAPVPEPSTLALLSMAAAGLLLLSRCRQRVG